MSCIFSIKNLVGEDSGQYQEYEKSGSLEVEGEKIPVEFEVTFMKTDDSIVAICRNIKFEKSFSCSRCLKKKKQKNQIESAEREFLFKRPEVVEDENDLFLVDKKAMKLDLEEMLRQEILLHCGLFPICSKTCKGLCPECGQDQNEKKCHHKARKENVENQFQQLKNLLKN